ncbi:hypothetical protein SmJEL517_g00331 [Synchytrium microbalum]|uniref:histone acetyltransferase n=1 Tax=Synchytrium microbalum TaxID=1806994 RepID=A0A507CIV1_9FUNG|nr:uncharacterized protein SmJEL517_g00331 [Synchytrium microbalum]TPX38094.1 hypothetical protein SmJEL517_g00331 [Synchytrium microbalum]
MDSKRKPESLPGSPIVKKAKSDSMFPPAADEDSGGGGESTVPEASIVDGEAENEEEEAKKPPSRAIQEEQAGSIQFRVVVNDGTAESMILLTGLKNIFQKQLPKMPKEYIARLVYDRTHVSMAVVRDQLIVVGGITYRPFEARRFGEIVFCAIASNEQVKGYGSRLMSHLKDYVAENSNIQHFLTYADNYAIGYFKKQGFTTDITLDKSIWVGYIKDYEGGTIMQCTMLPKVRYLAAHDILSTQRRAVLQKIQQIAKGSYTIHPGLNIFKKGVKQVAPESIPGLLEAGWVPEMAQMPSKPPARTRGPLYPLMRKLVAEMVDNSQSWPFHEPVTGVPDYYKIITEPMDLRTLGENVEDDTYQTFDAFSNDVQRIFDNCRKYNEEGSNYVKCATKLEKFFKERSKQLRAENRDIP